MTRTNSIAGLLLLMSCSAGGCRSTEPLRASAQENADDEQQRPPQERKAGDDVVPRLTTSEDKARRLARAIYSDIAIFHVEEIAGHPPENVSETMRQPLTEGREIFESRVSAGLHPVYQEEFPYLLRAVSHRLQFDSAESARYFARAILRHSVRESSDRSSAIEGARQFYRARVSQPLHSEFETSLAELGIDGPPQGR